MLKPEDARKQLKSLEVSDGYARAESRLGSLPRALADIGQCFLSRAQQGFVVRDEEKQRDFRSASIALDGLNDKDRQKLFAALLPPIAPYVEASWQLQMKLPYQGSLLRKAFRAPQHPAYTRRVRCEWLANLLKTTLPYKYDLDFLISWAPHIYWADQSVGLLLAAVLDSGDSAADATYASLLSIVNGQHETAHIGRYVITALLCSSRREAWETVERLLLAAQRQEGLRQVVLESIDLAHPEAFRRMLRLIDDHDLSRFSAVARAVAVWFGMPVDSADAKSVNTLIVQLAENLESDARRDQRLISDHGQAVYLALWSLAFVDVTIATERARQLLDAAEPERRYAATHLLCQLQTAEGFRVLQRCFADPDLRVAVKAASAFAPSDLVVKEMPHSADIFEQMEALSDRVPKEKDLGTIIWAWNRIQANPEDLALKLVRYRKDRPWSRLVRHIPAMSAAGRQVLLKSIESDVKVHKRMDPAARDIVLSLLSDASNHVRELAFKALDEASLAPEEALELEPLLSRKASDLRRGVIRLLLKQPDEARRASAGRLLKSADPLMKQAGEEMLSEIEPKPVAPATLEDGLGLFDPAQRTSPAKPRDHVSFRISNDTSKRILLSLDALVDQHRETSVTYKVASATISELLGNIRFPPKPSAFDFPMDETWDRWWSTRPADLRDPDGLELPRGVCAAILRAERRAPEWQVELKFPQLVSRILQRLLVKAIPAGAVDFLLNALETVLGKVASEYRPEPNRPWGNWQLHSMLGPLVQTINACREAQPQSWTGAHWAHYWGLLRWIDEGMADRNRHRPPIAATLEARRMGAATDADLYENLIGGNPVPMSGRLLYPDLGRFTRRKPDKLCEAYPDLSGIVSRCRDRIIEIELSRGDLPTAASAPAIYLHAIYGAELALKILTLLGKEPLARGWLSDSQSKAVVFSHLLRVSLPLEGDTPQAFAECARQFQIPRQRLVELAIYTPQWAAFAEHATGIAGLEDAAFWLYAHTKDTQWRVEEQIREIWFAEVSERTPLSKADLLEGGVDVAWFHQVRSILSPKDWSAVLDSAKYASGGSGHMRAEIFAAALAGETGVAELTAQIRGKRHQDSVRALGLVPLPQAAAERRDDLLRRYQVMQEFLRGAGKFGSQRQASEKLAVSIGLANLARTAGYPDPQRLSWAMEAEAVADLRQGPVTATESDVTVSLAINAEGEPELTTVKNGKSLKDVPPSLKKAPAIAALRARKTHLEQQTSRMRLSLEEAMVRGDEFTRKELLELAAHPLLRPMFDLLLFVKPDGAIVLARDLPESSEHFRIAHPTDLLASGDWPRLQQDCFANARRQPFKQAFRELYVLTGAECEQKIHSSRYEGHQVNPQQALAVIGKRGWVNVQEEGLRRTFHHDGISAWVSFLEGCFTPAEVDGLTVEHVFFTRRNNHQAVDLDQVNARVFSEAMRDLDLMVSVAHRGGVDPEASASTIEMRLALLRETLALLKIGNVRLTGRHAFVDGKIGAYNIHLGSGTVHRQPGGSLCVVPVHSQHRGRIFLPFADDDPKTAEIVSKVLLFAKDDEIKDPTILEQLRRG